MLRIALAIALVLGTAVLADARPRHYDESWNNGFGSQAPLSDSLRVPSANGF